MNAAGKGNRYACEQVVEIDQEPRHHLVIQNEFVRAFAVEIAPHDRTLCHHHPHDYLLYVANGGDEIISAGHDEEPKRLSYYNQHCELLPGGLVHVVENLGEEPFRNVVVELLPRAAELSRGLRPERSVVGKGTVLPIFDHERASILLIRIQSGADIKIFGPALVATPYGNRLNPEGTLDIEVKTNHVSDLAWIPPGRAGVLWGCWQQAETAVVFQIGRTDEQGYTATNVRPPLHSLCAHADDPD
jgi:hypothetical protein